MNTIQQQLSENLTSLPFYTNGKLDPVLLQGHINEYNCSHPIFWKGRHSLQNIGNRTVLRSISNNLVINRLQSVMFDKNKNDKLLQLKHDNIEKILYVGYTKHFTIWITPVFVTKLQTVWEKLEQFKIYDVKKMFSDLLNGLKYMKSQNVASGVIHEDNLAYNGQSWYISGIINADKIGECASGVYITSSLKSKRFMSLSYRSYRKNDRKNDYIPEDDLWQLILMYVITYYGFNPFQDPRKRFVPKNGTLLSAQPEDLHIRIHNGNCQDITLTTKADVFGLILKKLLTSTCLNDVSYNLFCYIIEHNGTMHTEGLNELIDQENRASIERETQERETQERETQERETQERETQERETQERELEREREIITALENPIVSVNIDQYVEKFKECECVICFSNTIKYRFLLCQHEICCDSCFQRLENKKCPMCREPIVKTEVLSLDYIEKLNEERKEMYFHISSI
jgi:hypothetical protein